MAAEDRTLGGYIQRMQQPQKDPYAGMRPDFAERLMLMQAALQDRGIVTNIISGVRDNAKQAALYAQGRTAPGPIVTNAQAGSSLHNYGAAADIVAADRSQQAMLHAALKELTGEHGLQWGGNFKSLYDPNHVQLPTTARQLAAGGATPAQSTPLSQTVTSQATQAPSSPTPEQSVLPAADAGLAAALQSPLPRSAPAMQDARQIEAQRARELALLTGQGRLAALFS